MEIKTLTCNLKHLHYMEIKTKCFNLQVLSEDFAWKFKRNVLISIRVYFDPVGIP